MNFTLKYLRYFVATGKYGNFARAAEELYVSKSSVIGAVTSLEREFGLDLFVRQPGKGLSITIDGKRVLGHAIRILDEVKSFDDEISSIGKTLTGTLVIGCYEVLAPYFMADIFSALRGRYPELTVEVVEGSLEDMQRLLAQGEVDALLTYNVPTLPSTIAYEVLKTANPYVIMTRGHALAKHKSVSLRQLADYPMVLFDLGISGPFYTGYFQELGYSPDIILRCKSSEAVRGYVGAGLGFSILHIRPPSATTYNNHKLIYKRLRDSVKRPQIVAGYAKPTNGKPSRQISVFMDECRTLFKSDRVLEFFS